MPIIDHRGRTANDIPMYLGANPRPHNPLAPKLSTVLDPTKADLTREQNLGNFSGKDYRSPIKNQGSLGSCTGATTCEDAEMCARIDGSNPPALSIGFVYEMERRMEGSFPQDSGAFTDDGVTIAAQSGIPADSIHPYDAQAATEYNTQQAQTDAAQRKYIASHLVIDVRSPDVLKLIWMALSTQMPCYLETYWYESFFNPNTVGALPLTYDSIAGGHSISLYGIIPDASAPGGGYLALSNHWSNSWNTQAASYGHALRAGDFLMPWAMLLSPNTPVMHIGAVSPSQVQPIVDPAAPLKQWEPGAWSYYLQSNDPNWLKTIGQTDVAWAQYLGSKASLTDKILDKIMKRKPGQPPLPPIPKGK